MKAYRHSVNLKLGLVLFAVIIAVSSLLYTNRLVERLRDREQFIIGLWAGALEQLVRSAQNNDNPYLRELSEMREMFRGEHPAGAPLSAERRQAYRAALDWATSMPQSEDVTYLTEILDQGRFGIPAVIIDSSDGTPILWQNVPVPDTLGGLSSEDSIQALQHLRALATGMARVHEPIPVEIVGQYIFYGESQIIRELRLFPYIQLLVITLFVLVGYVGFSYVRRSEQGSLWVGMAREAAHQLGTPISSLMGWHELLQTENLSEVRQKDALTEVGRDIERLNRVTSRFSAIGSVPRLEKVDLRPVIEETVAYMQRRIPEHGTRVKIEVDVPPNIQAPLNTDLFEWVIENMIKNALDAIESNEGRIHISASAAPNQRIYIDVADTGKGIDRRNWKNVFRPGFSTKKRGWGLGLSLAKRVVEVYHGGKLSLHASRPGQGTTFRIELRGDQTGSQG